MMSFADLIDDDLPADWTNTLTVSFDQAWDRVVASGSIYASEPYAERARTALAKRIVFMARQGERDGNQLVADGLGHLARLRLRASAV